MNTSAVFNGDLCVLTRIFMVGKNGFGFKTNNLAVSTAANDVGGPMATYSVYLLTTIWRLSGGKTTTTKHLPS